MFKLGIIGVGNMGEAIIKGIINKKILSSDQILIYDKIEEKAKNISESYGVGIAKSNSLLSKLSEIIILAVKPQDLEKTVNEIKDSLTEDKILVSILAGVSLGRIKSLLNINIPVVRVMPNTPALVGDGSIAVSFEDNLNNEKREYIKSLLSALGKVYEVEEKLMDVITGLSGSGPAYVFTFIDALAQGGVKKGLPYQLALDLAIQTVLGSAKLLQETREHPMVLRDKVSSPAGTTIYGLHSLEKHNFRNAVISAVEEATERSKELGKN